jgi:hypothetical protein
MTDADRKFQAGDLVRLRPQSTFWPEFKEETLKVIAVEEGPLQMGTYWVRVETLSGGRKPTLRAYEFERIS